ncbi:nucleoside 2-deoxyribosyltransferase domain-containing protein [Thiothrix fructosivorans]|uniref:nucleoside 2-deoxyribosyltransferase domain-containing protein n=1 Tax=Thiothrix fructosivorans TaxID=111770 RepID=UPI0024176412|nr:nucleoside 2-deoxyribosyltransferase domain-containing protein [Thiothrix fructosivorans]
MFNPLRPNFPIDDPSASVFQIQWEHEYLRKATAILFWFPAETLCPITLYELGAWSMTTKPLFVGVHPDYARIADVELQTRLVRPDVEIVYSVQALAAQLRHLM